MPAVETDDASLEREADRFADAFVAGGRPEAVPPPRRLDWPRPALLPPSTLGSGDPLEAGVRTRLEAFAGVDLSTVRVHRDGAAAATAERLGASALATGDRIAIGAGEPALASREGERLLAHEIAHVVQQRTRGPGLQLRRHRPRRPEPAELGPEGAALVAALTGVDPELGEFAEDFLRYMTRFLAALGTREAGGRADLAASVTEMQQASSAVTAEPTPGRARTWLATAQLSLGQVRRVTAELREARPFYGVYTYLTVPFDETGGLRRQQARLTEWSVELNGVLLGALPGWELAGERRRREEDERARDPFHAAVADLRRWLARAGNRQVREQRPSLAAAIFAEIIARRIGRDPAAVARFFERLGGEDARLLEAVTAEGHTARILQGESSEEILASIGRVLLHALMGEWYEGHGEVEPSEWDRLAEYGVTTREAEADLEDGASIVADVSISLVPGVDQIFDLRDLSAFVFRLLDLDGQHGDAVADPMQWAGLVLTLIGVIPEVGSVLHGVGKVGLRFGGAIAEALGPGLRRLVPDAMEALTRALRHAQGQWDAVVRVVRDGWRQVTTRLDQFFAALGAVARQTFEAVAERWRLVKERAVDMIPDGLRRAFQTFASIASALTDGVRRVADAVLARVQRLTRQLTATGRMTELDRTLDALASAQTALREALETGADPGTVRRLVGEAASAADEGERQLRALGEAGGEATETATETVEAGAEATRRVEPTPTRADEVVEAVHGEQLVDEIETVRAATPSPSQVEGYDLEVAVGGGHFWRRQSEPPHAWCRFSNDPSQCVPGAAVHGAGATPRPIGERGVRELVDDIMMQDPATAYRQVTSLIDGRVSRRDEVLREIREIDRWQLGGGRVRTDEARARRLAMLHAEQRQLQEELVELRRAQAEAERRLDPMAATRRRRTPQESERDVGRLLGADFEAQPSFQRGESVAHGTEGSTRPDFYSHGERLSIDVKNYDVSESASALVANIAAQARARAPHLPPGSRQGVYIDVRGQRVGRAFMDEIRDAIVARSNGLIAPGDIHFLTE